MRTNIPRTFAPNVPKHDMKLAINPTIHCRIGCCADGKYEKSFSNVFEPVERLLVPLNFAWRSAKNLSIICSSDQYSAAFDRVSVPQHHHCNVHYTYLYLHKSGDLQLALLLTIIYFFCTFWTDAAKHYIVFVCMNTVMAKQYL